MLKPKAPSLRERRNLFEGYWTRQGSALQPRRSIPKSLLGGVDSIPLDPPQPGFNDGSFLRAPAHQRRIGVEFFKVAAYRNDIGNRRTAIEFEYWNHAIRIQGAERRRDELPQCRPKTGHKAAPLATSLSSLVSKDTELKRV